MEWKGHSQSDRPIAGSRILLVEDDPFIQMELEAFLIDNGVHVVGPCSSVKEALAIAGAHPIDAAILDFGLIDGTSGPVARFLVRAGIPFLFYTGQLKTDARLAEWTSHLLLPKPSKPEQIKAALATLLNRSRGSV